MYQLGHTAVFTGDTVFLESVGRPDLADQAEAFAHSLYRSCTNGCCRSATTSWSFPRTTAPSWRCRPHEFVARPLGELRVTLPALALRESEFVAWALANVKDRPPNYQHIVVDQRRVAKASMTSRGNWNWVPNRCAVA